MKTLRTIALIIVLAGLAGCGKSGQIADQPVPKAPESSAMALHGAEMFVTVRRDSGTNHLTVGLTASTIAVTKEVLNPEDKALVTPTFLRHESGNDVYRFELEYPLGTDSASVTVKEVSFDGRDPATVFAYPHLTVAILPKGSSEQAAAADGADAAVEP
jgi:hypothetical protein